MSDIENDDLETLLRQAGPRPVPAPADVAAAKTALRSEWHDVTGRRRTRRRLAGFAIAATVLAGVFAVYNAARVPVVDAVQVATIAKSFGPVYVLGERAELRPTDGLLQVASGQTIVTGSGAGIALAWANGGSLRIDEDTRIRFARDDAVFLESGRAYFDSVAGAASAVEFKLITEHGEVRHLGTQYMTEVDRDRLLVSVREGSVTIDGVYHEQTLAAGQQALLAGRQRPSVLSISRSGDAWNWVVRTAPAADMDGRTLYEFLVWVSREMGLELRFEGASERVAHEAILRGTIDTEPAEALRLRLATAALDWRIEGGVIYITE